MSLRFKMKRPVFRIRIRVRFIQASGSVSWTGSETLKKKIGWPLHQQFTILACLKAGLLLWSLPDMLPVCELSDGALVGLVGDELGLPRLHHRRRVGPLRVHLATAIYCNIQHLSIWRKEIKLLGKSSFTKIIILYNTAAF